MRKVLKSFLSLLCLVACCPLCFPCYICALKKYRKRNRPHETRNESHWHGPKSLSLVYPLHSRKRRLSVTTTTERPLIGLELDQKVCLQDQALIFTKLPAEVRAQIWQEVVGGYEIYLGIAHKRIRHCKVFGGFGVVGCDIDEQEQDKLQAECMLLPLLQTCRRIYSEAVPFLYSTNTFITSHLEVIQSLTSTIRLPRFESISSITMTWSLHNVGPLGSLRYADALAWDRASRTLASMKGLKALKVTIWGRTIYGMSGDWTAVRQLLDYLSRVKRPRKYTVRIDEDDVTELAKEYDTAPFRLEWLENRETLE